ncbi:MAG: flagellar biosynthesis protein FliQ [Alphaproteobacteria bacterium]
MSSAEIIEVLQDALYILLIVSAPAMLVALFVGLVIALFQALTQIQEATLTFVPKILAMIITLSLSLPFMFETLTDFAHELHDKIVHIE